MQLQITPVDFNKNNKALHNFSVRQEKNTFLKPANITFSGEKPVSKKSLLALTAGLASLFLLPNVSKIFAGEINLNPFNQSSTIDFQEKSPWELPGETPLESLSKEELKQLIKDYQNQLRKDEYPLFDRAYTLMTSELSEANDQMRLTLPTWNDMMLYQKAKNEFKENMLNLKDIVAVLEKSSGYSSATFPESLENMLKDDKLEAAKKEQLQKYFGYYENAFKFTEEPANIVFTYFSQAYEEDRSKIADKNLAKLLQKYEDTATELQPKIEEAKKRLQEIEQDKKPENNVQKDS